MHYAVREHRIDGNAAVGGKLDKAFGEISVTCGKCRTDFPLGNIAIKNTIQGLIADLDRVVGRCKSRLGSQPAVNERKRRCREQDRASKRKSRVAQRTDRIAFLIP